MTDAKPLEPTAASPAPESTTPPTTVDPLPAEEKTQPYRLRDLAVRLAQRRRRTTAGELVFRRDRTDVRVPLDRSETVIGRDAACDIVLTEPAASARHARIVRTAGGYFELHDLRSVNGTLVDGEPVTSMTLLDGDTFMIGDTRFRIIVAPIVGEEP